MGYLTVDEIDTKLDALASNPDYSGYVDVFNLNHNTEDENHPVKCIKIGKGNVPVLLVGGIHAREWAPPDALVNLASKLLSSYKNSRPFVDSRFEATLPDSDPDNDGVYAGRIVFEEQTFPYPEVKKIIDRLAIFIIPCVNRDGRKFSQAANALKNRWWRTNRHNLGTVCASGPSPAIGVDINRNFPPVWDMSEYYNPAGESTAMQATGTDACDSSYHPPYDPAVPGHIADIYEGYHKRATFHGNSMASENETKNVTELVQEKNIKFYIDIHGFAREIYYPWGFNTNQTNDTSKSFLNSTLDRSSGSGRPYNDPSYAEYFPKNGAYDLLTKHIHLANQMKNAVFSAAGSDAHARNRMKYEAKQAIDLYPAPGASDDFVLSTQLSASGNNASLNSEFPVHAFTMESGHESDGEFWPSMDPAKNQYRKVQREIHAVSLELLKYAANWTAPASGSGSAPGSGSGSPESDGCLLFSFMLMAIISGTFAALLLFILKII
jgi:hypothetical protein